VCRNDAIERRREAHDRYRRSNLIYRVPENCVSVPALQSFNG
jgi:hypothetical protein